MKYPKLRELKEALKALIKGPYTGKFPYLPHKPFAAFRGKTKYDADSCIGCTACFQVCPAGAIKFEDRIENGKAKRVFRLHWDVCIFCGQCQANCPTQKGIALSQEFDLAVTENRQELKQEIEKELVTCRCCGEIIAPRDQILWVAKKIGPLSFANSSLMLFYLQGMGLSGEKEAAFENKSGEVLRSDRLTVLCPRCRREAVVKS